MKRALLMEKRLLQAVVVAASAVPLLGGMAGVVAGPAMAGGGFGAAADSQFRYLSGLLVGIGAAYLSLAPRIEREGRRLFMLTLIVVIGGFARAIGMLTNGPPGGMSAALIMELVVAPAVYVWQGRIAARCASPPVEADVDASRPWG
jgi:hypothetical protein